MMMTGYNMKKEAFTMIELVLVIVVLGILAAMAMPRLDRDLQQEAADTILSNIRYTQHLALTDDKHRFNDPTWQRAFWRISFENCSGGNIFLTVGTDMDGQGDIDLNEAALDPTNGKPMFWRNTLSCQPGDDLSSSSENIFVGKKNGVTAVTGAGSCAGVQYIGFDHLGRPHVGFTNSGIPDYSSYINTRCTFTFTMSSGPALVINIEPETGYSYIANQLGS